MHCLAFVTQLRLKMLPNGAIEAQPKAEVSCILQCWHTVTWSQSVGYSRCVCTE